MTERAYPGIKHAVLLSGAVVVLQMMASMPLLMLSPLIGVSLVQHPGGLAVMNLIAFGAVLSWGMHKNDVPAATIFYFRPASPSLIFPVILTALGMGVLLSEADNLFRYVFPVPAEVEKIFRTLMQNQQSWFGAFFLLVIVAPITEELLFRGLIFRGLLARYRFRTAALVSSALFALVHLNPWQFVSAFFLGLVFAWFVLKTGSIWPAIVGHALHNSLTFVAGRLPFEIQGFISTELPPPGVFHPWWLDIIGFVLAVTGLAWFKQSARAAQIQNPPQPPVIDPGIV